MRSWTVRTLVVVCGLVLAGCTSDGAEVSPEASATASATASPVGAYALDADAYPDLEGYVLNLGGGGVFNLMDFASLVTAGNYSVDGDALTWLTDSFCAGDEEVEQATYTWVLDDGTLRLTPKGVDGCEERVNMYSHRFELLVRPEVIEYEAKFGEEFTTGLSTDGDGAGSVTVSYAAEPGDHVLNVNVVAYSGGAAGQDDPRPREIGPDAFAKLTVPGERVVQTLYGDGDIRCPDHWAHDLSLPVGTVQYQPGESGIEITVTLDQAWPDTEYYVEVNTDAFCAG